jgi:signal transduction histidine kinase
MRLRFAARLALAHSVLIVAACAGLSTMLVRFGRADLGRSLAERGRATAELIARESELSMLSGNVQGLIEVADGVRAQPGVMYVRFVDGTDRVLAAVGPVPSPDLVDTITDDHDLPSPAEGVVAWEFRTPIVTQTIRPRREELLADRKAGDPSATTRIGFVGIGMDLSSLRSHGHRVAATAASVTIVVVLLAVVSAVLLAKATTRHLAALARAADAVALGQLDGTVIVPTRDEVGGLAQSFNAMVESLRQSRAAVAEQQRTLEDKVRARTERLEAMNRELEQAHRTKSEFLATVSHELRTPLNVILGYTELLEDGAVGEVTPEQRELLGSIEHYSRLQLDLITNVLDFERLVSGQISTHAQQFELAALVEDIRRLHGDRRDVRVPLHTDVAAGVPTLETDRVKLLEIVRNLVDNASKFTAKGSITVQGWSGPTPGWITIVVRDTGPGIAAEDLPSIFDEFRQVGDHYTRRTGGVGLGLAIVKRLVDVLGGRIAVESVVGEGTTFRIELPARLPKRAGGPLAAA